MNFKWTRCWKDVWPLWGKIKERGPDHMTVITSKTIRFIIVGRAWVSIVFPITWFNSIHNGHSKIISVDASLKKGATDKGCDGCDGCVGVIDVMVGWVWWVCGCDGCDGWMGVMGGWVCGCDGCDGCVGVMGMMGVMGVMGVISMRGQGTLSGSQVVSMTHLTFQFIIDIPRSISNIQNTLQTTHSIKVRILKWGWTNFIVVREVLRNNYWSCNLIVPYHFWVITPRNSTLSTRPFLTGRCTRLGLICQTIAGEGGGGGDWHSWILVLEWMHHADWQWHWKQNLQTSNKWLQGSNGSNR